MNELEAELRAQALVSPSGRAVLADYLAEHGRPTALAHPDAESFEASGGSGSGYGDGSGYGSGSGSGSGYGSGSIETAGAVAVA